MSIKPLAKRDIVIVGGSLGGLMVAIPLIRLGHNVTIIERSPTPLLHDQGAGIVAGGETLEFWSKFKPGVHPNDSQRWKARDIAVHSRQRLYLDVKGKVIDRDPWEQRMTSWDLLYYLGRAAFDGVDSEYLVKQDASNSDDHTPSGGGKAKYEFGRSVTSIREVDDRIEISYSDSRDHTNGDTTSASDTMTADFLIAADGPSSTLRPVLIPNPPPRTYVGYVAFRGTVPELNLSSSAKTAFVESFTFYHGTGCQILAYTIPGAKGTLTPGERLINWVWYWNFPESSEEFKNVMTDRDGKHHRFTLPSGGKMRDDVWGTQKSRADEFLPPQFAELVNKTTNPFVQAITDLPPPPSDTKITRLLGGKALLLGDALAGFRPHTAASTSQAALHALLVDKVFKGEMSWDEYEKKVLDHAKFWVERGIMLGERSQFGVHPMAGKTGTENKTGGEDNDKEVSWQELNMRKQKRKDVVLEAT